MFWWVVRHTPLLSGYTDPVSIQPHVLVFIMKDHHSVITRRDIGDEYRGGPLLCRNSGAEESSRCILGPASRRFKDQHADNALRVTHALYNDRECVEIVNSVS